MTTKVAFVTGHEFGMAALEGMLSSHACRTGALEVAALVVLDRSASQRTVGFAGDAPPPDYDGRIESTPDGRLLSVLPVLREAEPQFLCVIGWSYLVPTVILDLPKEHAGSPVRHSPSHGSIGMHPSLLPHGRGRAPLPWSILEGGAETGLTAFHLEEEPDVGAVVWQERIRVHARETATSLFAKVKRLHRQAGGDLADAMASGTVTAKPQDDSKAVVWPKRTPSDSEIEARSTVSEIDRLVRAQSTPYPPAFVEADGRRFMVHSAVALDFYDRPGTEGVIEAGDQFVDFGARDGSVRLLGFWAEA